MKGDKALQEATQLIKKIINGKLTISQKYKLHDRAISLLRQAAYSGNSNAQFEYAQSHYETYTHLSLDNPNYNPKKLVYWYSKACEGGFGEACNNLANLYETGTGCKKDLSKALKLYKRSAELGCELGKKNYKLMLKQMSKDGIYGKKDKLFFIPQG